jgi:hypothetical protein
LALRSELDESVRSDRHFEFRIDVTQKRASGGEADLAAKFVREEDLTAEERQAYEALECAGRVIIRDKESPVMNLNAYRPSAM